jgi:hypothetical protein
MIVVRTNKDRLEKAKYIRRWKGKDGKWRYEYKRSSKNAVKKKPERANKPKKMKREDLPENVIYHSSPEKIKKIEANRGIFGDVLFFASQPYSMSGGVKEDVVYAMDTDNLDLIEEFNLLRGSDYKKLDPIIDDIVQYYDKYGIDVKRETAEDLLIGSEMAINIGNESAGDFSWYIQGKQGEAAKLLGYDGAISRDEQGTVYIVPMFGRESDLIEIIEGKGKDKLKKEEKRAQDALSRVEKERLRKKELYEKYDSQEKIKEAYDKGIIGRFDFKDISKKRRFYAKLDTEEKIISGYRSGYISKEDAIDFAKERKLYDIIDNELKKSLGGKSMVVVRTLKKSKITDTTLWVKVLSNKHKVSPSVIEEQIEMGSKEELEHTSDMNEARKIAVEHLSEDPHYYHKLDATGLMEKAIVIKNKPPKKKKKYIIRGLSGKK